MALVSICVIFASQAVFWFLGDQVLNEYILSRKQDSKVESFIKYVYLLSVCSSLTLLELLACEILDIIPRNLRWFLWKFNLFILLNLLIFLIPFIQARVLFFYRSTTPYPKLLIVIFLVYLWFIYKLGSLFPLMDPSVSTSLFSIEQGISRVGIVGITLMAFISGYGSVSGPATYIFVKQVSYDQVESAEKNYLHTQKLLEERREAFQKYCEQKISGNNSSDSSTINWFLKRVSTAMSMNPNSQESTPLMINNSFYST
jgi:golgi pH regulator